MSKLILNLILLLWVGSAFAGDFCQSIGKKQTIYHGKLLTVLSCLTEGIQSRFIVSGKETAVCETMDGKFDLFHILSETEKRQLATCKYFTAEYHE